MAFGDSVRGRHSYFLFLLFSQRCHGKCQFLVCSTWNSGYIDLCSNSILYFLLRPYPGEKASENTLSTPECLACTAFADSGTLHPIRGGFSVSTMNLSKVYFSQDQRMNHAAINPAFSFMYSATHQNNFDKQYRFMDPKIADELFAEMVDKPVAVTDSIPQLLNTQRPNIIFIILESFSTHLMETFGGQPNVAVNMDKFAKEGVLFSNFYGSSFRTDRGLASIISGYPGQPSTSIMKYPEKTDKLPSIPRSLKNAGYSLEYYYGGDADFTNMRSYLVSSGIEKIISDKDFPLSERTGKWGAQDHVLFQRLMKDLKEEKQEEPFLKLVQTSSSHELRSTGWMIKSSTPLRMPTVVWEIS